MEQPDVVMAWAAIATAALTLGLLVVAIFAFRAAKGSWKAATEANRQMERDSREQSRPYVTAQILPGLAGITTWDLKITNTGRTVARHLTMDYDQWPTKNEGGGEALETWDSLSRGLHTMFTTPRTLAPGASLRVMWLLDRGPDEDIERSDDPKAGTYNDSFEVMIENSGSWPVPEDGPNPPEGLGKLAKRADELMQVLIRRVGELGR